MRMAATRSLLIGGIVLGTSTHAIAADVPLTSKVDAVTVFLSGAEVTRIAKVNLEKGEHTIVINDVPAGAVPGSIRVEGKATGKLDIGSVDTTRKYLQRAESQAADGERKTLEDELEALRDQKTALEAQALAAETQKTLIANLAQLPTRPSPTSGGSVLPEDWSRTLTTIAQGTAEASRLEMDARVKIRDLDRRIDDLDKKLGALMPPLTEQTEVRINVAATSTLEADLTIRYQVSNANWTPIYDARLVSGSKTDPAKLELARRAAITQRTNENWSDVTLELSTARPSDGAAAPVLDTQIVDFEPEIKPMAAPVASTTDRLRKLQSAERRADAAQDQMSLGGAVDMDVAAVAPPPAPIEEAVAVVTAAPFEATYAVPGKVSVSATGETKRVLLSSDTLAPTLSSRSVPKVDSNSYLYATFQIAKGSPLLPGRVYLFRDGTFVGTGELPLLSPEVEHDLGFGIDDQVKVRHAVLEEKRGETGLISTSRVDSRNFRVTVKNLHERPIDLKVYDRLPVSQNQDIKVEYTGKETPTAQNSDEKRGVMRFDARLEPDEEKVLEYGYRISWPAAKSIIYGP
jgi:uncharacterized protein (TIGR02231 family)